MSKAPVIIDCAPRCLNSLGLVLALSSEKLDVKGIVVPTFTQREKKAPQNALRLAELLNAETPVIVGAATPLLGNNDHISFPKETGAGYRTLSESSAKLLDENYIDFYYRTLNASHEKVSLITMGPLTDIGALLLAYPETVKKIDRILVSGGTWLNGLPNIPGIAAEGNILADPEAANIVFGAGIPLYLFGDNVCNQIFDVSAFEPIKNSPNDIQGFISDIVKCHYAPGKKEARVQSLFKSACPVAYLIDPSLFEMKNYAITIDLVGDFTRGCTVVDNRFETGRTKFVPTHTHIAVKMDSEGLKNLIINL